VFRFEYEPILIINGHNKSYNCIIGLNGLNCDTWLVKRAYYKPRAVVGWQLMVQKRQVVG